MGLFTQVKKKKKKAYLCGFHVYVEVRGQLEGLGFPLLSMGCGDRTQLPGFDRKWLSCFVLFFKPSDQLAGPQLLFFKANFCFGRFTKY